MKKPVVKILSISLCVLLALGGIGGTVYAMGVSTDAASPDAAPVDSSAESTAPKTSSSYDPERGRSEERRAGM